MTRMIYLSGDPVPSQRVDDITMSIWILIGYLPMMGSSQSLLLSSSVVFARRTMMINIIKHSRSQIMPVQQWA